MSSRPLPFPPRPLRARASSRFFQLCLELQAAQGVAPHLFENVRHWFQRVLLSPIEAVAPFGPDGDGTGIQEGSQL